MIYWVIIDERPEPISGAGRIKFKVSGSKFEKLCQQENNMFQINDDVFKIDNKKIISLEEHHVMLLVCDDLRLKQKD